MDTEQKGEINLSLLDIYGPAQIGRVLSLLSLMYEGTRIALLAPYENMENLFNHAIAPELYEAQRDEYSLRLVSARPGSWELILTGVVGVLQIVLAAVQIKKELQSKKSKAEPNRAQSENAEKPSQKIESQYDARIRHAEKLLALAGTPGLAGYVRMALYDKVVAVVGEHDHPEERAEIIYHVNNRTATNLIAIRDKLGGEFKILGQDLLPDRLYPDDYKNEDDQKPHG